MECSITPESKTYQLPHTNYYIPTTTYQLLHTNYCRPTDFQSHCSELHNCRLVELRERQRLDVDLTGLTNRVTELEDEACIVQTDLRSAQDAMAEKQFDMTQIASARDELQGHVTSLTQELEERHRCRQAELDAVENRYKSVMEESETAHTTVQFMLERQR